jgi:hypothetical protein
MNMVAALIPAQKLEVHAKACRHKSRDRSAAFVSPLRFQSSSQIGPRRPSVSSAWRSQGGPIGSVPGRQLRREAFEERPRLLDAAGAVIGPGCRLPEADMGREPRQRFPGSVAGQGKLTLLHVAGDSVLQLSCATGAAARGRCFLREVLQQWHVLSTQPLSSGCSALRIANR